MKKIFNKKSILIALYAFLIAFLTLMLASKNSFLYPFNDWVDANAFFTVGKSMFHGIVPYKDLFEQKGPLLYFIYGIASIISFKSFLGVFILEVLFWTVALIYLYKILKLFLSTRVSLLILPIFMSLIVTTRAFTHGGSAEEFCVPFFFITLYYFIKHFKVKELTKKEMLLNGIIAGLVLLIKYTLLGFWFGFTLAIFIDYIMQKDYKKAIIYPLVLLLGMFIPFTIFIIYFAINHAVGDFFYNYFWVNITAYGGEKINIFTRINNMLVGLFGAFYNNMVCYIALLCVPILIWKLDLKLRGKVLLLVTLFITIIGVYVGLKFYRYYLLFILFFLGIGLLCLFNLLNKYINKLNKWYYPLIVVVVLISGFNAYYNSNNKAYFEIKKEDLFQYKFANIISAEENPSIVNMGFLDSGTYTLAGIYPSTYFFQKQNIKYEYFPDILDSFEEYIKNKETMFIVYYTLWDEKLLKEKEPYLFLNYDLIMSIQQDFEEFHMYGHLFKVKST